MSEHLFEADKVRINNEAKVRTALEQPDFAQREFEKWRTQKERQLRSETFTDAWAKVAWLAEGRTLAIGRELAKAQARIGRQRRANRELLLKLRERNSPPGDRTPYNNPEQAAGERNERGEAG